MASKRWHHLFGKWAAEQDLSERGQGDVSDRTMAAGDIEGLLQMLQVLKSLVAEQDLSERGQGDVYQKSFAIGMGSNSNAEEEDMASQFWKSILGAGLSSNLNAEEDDIASRFLKTIVGKWGARDYSLKNGRGYAHGGGRSH
ncbi:uncharacterized protein [Diadema setosum]|uniref:uncharacterized protein n=1 Tax=Diadema setosum TaxID=31175 RepID=UPI003B3B53B4